jgi:hypothetical protein
MPAVPGHHLRGGAVRDVTNTNKVFKTALPSTSDDRYGKRCVTYSTFELKTLHVENPCKAVAAALDKSASEPVAPATPSNKSGTSSQESGRTAAITLLYIILRQWTAGTSGCSL